MPFLRGSPFMKKPVEEIGQSWIVHVIILNILATVSDGKTTKPLKGGNEIRKNLKKKNKEKQGYNYILMYGHIMPDRTHGELHMFFYRFER